MVLAVAGACQWPFRAVSVLYQGHKPVHPCSQVADRLFAQKQKLVQVGKTNQKIDLVTFASSYFGRHLEQCQFNQNITSRYGVLILKPSFLWVCTDRQQMSLGIVVEDKESTTTTRAPIEFTEWLNREYPLISVEKKKDDSKVPPLVHEEYQQILDKELDRFPGPRIKPEITWKGEHSLEIGDDPARMVHGGLRALYARSFAPDPPTKSEPSSTTTTTTTTATEGWISYNMKSSQFGKIEDFPHPIIVTPAMLSYVKAPTEIKAEPSATTTAGEAKVEMVIREAPTFDLGRDDDEAPPTLVRSSDDESEPDTTATTVTTTTTDIEDEFKDIPACYRAPDSFTSGILRGQRLEQAARFNQDLSDFINDVPRMAPLPSTIHKVELWEELPPASLGIASASVPTEAKASETEELYAAFDKETSAWKQETARKMDVLFWDRHHHRAPSTPQDEEARRKVGLPPLGWTCLTCSRNFDYPSNLCEHEWRPVTSVEEVD